MGNGALVIPRLVLERAVAPASLIDALGSLRDNGVILGFDFRPARITVAPGTWQILHEVPQIVRIDGDRAALELATESLTVVEPDPPDGQIRVNDLRAEYYRRIDQFLHTREFKALPVVNRQIIELHSVGRSNQEIARQLQVTLKKVRVAVTRGRVLAGLPKVTTVMPRGGERAED